MEEEGYSPPLAFFGGHGFLCPMHRYGVACGLQSKYTPGRKHKSPAAHPHQSVYRKAGYSIGFLGFGVGPSLSVRLDVVLSL
jgi:hypothetical protein